jgi:multiple sugar transport system ATP-binding protein
MSEVALKDIRKSFGDFKLFEGISLTCPAQQYLCLIGPSGCGKTTLMRMIAGLEYPDAGDILIGGRRVNDLAPAERDIGLAFQNYALYPHLTVAGNLAFPLRAPVRKGRYGTADIEARIREVANLLQIETLLERSVSQLSGGQQQRVSLGRSLVCNPRVLLLDEPIAHLDARLRYETRAELKQLQRRVGTTTVHVTHDQLEALSIADLIVVIKDGTVQQVGPPLDLYNAPRNAFVASFIGDPPMSLLKAALVTEKGSPALRIGTSLVPLPPALAIAAAAAGSRDVLVGLRPSQVQFAEEGDEGALSATVYSHESIGRQVELMLAVEESLLRHRIMAVRKMRVGEPARLRLSLEGAKLFDGKRGTALP